MASGLTVLFAVPAVLLGLVLEVRYEFQTEWASFWDGMVVGLAIVVAIIALKVRGGWGACVTSLVVLAYLVNWHLLPWWNG